MNNNDEKVKEILNSEEVPEEISPENMKKMLDEKAPSKKRSGISMTGRIVAAAAACAVIVGGTVGTIGLINRKNPAPTVDDSSSAAIAKVEPTTENVPVIQSHAPYMVGAESYEQVYQLIQDSREKSMLQYSSTYKGGMFAMDDAEVASGIPEEDGLYFDGADHYDESSSVESYIPEAVAPAYDVEENAGMHTYDSFSENNEYGSYPNQSEPIIVPEEDEEKKEAPEEATEEPTEEVSEEATEEATEEVTEEVTEEETEEVTEEATEEETEEATEEETEAPTEEETEGNTEIAPDVTTEASTAVSTETTTESTTEATTEAATEDETEEGDEHSDTYSQEQNVLEADIAKTDGKRIYHIKCEDTLKLDVVSVKDGVFSDPHSIDIDIDFGWEGWETYAAASDMYLYNDMVAVIFSVNASRYNESEFDEEYYDDDYLLDDVAIPYNGRRAWESKTETVVAFYTTEKEPQLIGTYHQDGSYTDVRIAPDGYMYLISSYNANQFSYICDIEDYESYIPKCGVNGSSCIPPRDILLPGNDLDNSEFMSYTVIGSIDLTESGEFSPCDTKALAGYTGNIYCSADNLYTTVGWDDTDITRIAIGGGSIVPEASGIVEGCVKDQFSMSEYDGYFRIATTVEKWTDNGNFIKDIFDIPSDSEFIRDNRVYVLDMDMNTVGSVEGFGKNETIKSVNFSGNMGYVVTYEQTDPLFAIDLSDPVNPFITDKFKILGYSTYMQKWDDGLLLGFGPDADEHGIENGAKLVMFDNSDPYDLKEVGLYKVCSYGSDYDDYQTWSYSEAVYDRKCLMIAPEKNLIAVPVTTEYWGNSISENIFKYMFFSYNDGEFELKGEISKTYDTSGYWSGKTFERAMYIGDYVYAISGKCMISADMDTIEQVDEVDF